MATSSINIFKCEMRWLAGKTQTRRDSCRGKSPWLFMRRLAAAALAASGTKLDSLILSKFYDFAELPSAERPVRVQNNSQQSVFECPVLLKRLIDLRHQNTWPLTPASASPLIPPQRHAAQNAALVGDNAHVARRREEDLLRVATAQVEVVPVEKRFSLLNRGLKEVVPARLAKAVQAAAAQVVFVGHALLAPGMVAQFQAGAEMPAGKERRAQSGAES